MKKTASAETVTLSKAPSPVGELTVAGGAKGLLYVAFPGRESLARMEHWLAAHVPGAVIRRSGRTNAVAVRQLKEYFGGKRRTFDIPLDLRGTAFQKKVWRALTGIPHGKTATYGAIAGKVGKPGAARAVGGANNANPAPIVVPCHRVIGSDGSLTGFGGGLGLKRTLLELEGHSF